MTTTWGHPEDAGGSGPTVGEVLAWAKTRRAEPAVGPSEPSGVGSANIVRHTDHFGVDGHHVVPDLAKLTHEMCAELTNTEVEFTCTHTPAEMLQRGVSEIQRLRSHVDELVTRINRAEALAAQWDQSGADMTGRRAAGQLRAALEVAW